MMVPLYVFFNDMGHRMSLAINLWSGIENLAW